MSNIFSASFTIRSSIYYVKRYTVSLFSTPPFLKKIYFENTKWLFTHTTVRPGHIILYTTPGYKATRGSGYNLNGSDPSLHPGSLGYFLYLFFTQVKAPVFQPDRELGYSIVLEVFVFTLFL